MEAPAVESRRAQFERLLPAARARFERDRLQPENFYDQPGFHATIRGTRAPKTFFVYNPDTRDTLKDSVQEGEARAWTRDIAVAEKQKNDSPEKQAFDAENLLLGDLAEGVGYELLKNIFPGPRFAVVPGSFVDDRLNGNDVFVVERNDAGDVERVFGIDITAAPEPEVLAKKMTQSLRRTIRGEMGTGALVAHEHNGTTQRFSSEAVVKLILPLDEATVLAHAQRMARNEPLPFGATRRVAELFEHQIVWHERHARNDIQKVLAGARNSIGRMRANAVPDHPYQSWNNLRVLEQLHTDKALEKELMVIANDMNTEGKIAAKKRIALDTEAFIPKFLHAVRNYVPVGTTNVTDTMSFVEATPRLETSLHELQQRINTLATNIADTRRRVEALERRFGVYA